jgi:hypothetical protein
LSKDDILIIALGLFLETQGKLLRKAMRTYEIGEKPCVHVKILIKKRKDNNNPSVFFYS